MELAFVCMAKSLLAWSLRSTSKHVLVLRNVVRIDDDVIQIYDDYDINHVCENVVHES